LRLIQKEISIERLVMFKKSYNLVEIGSTKAKPTLSGWFLQLSATLF